MDYTKLKKEELIVILEEQRHLAEAVNAKDAEISKLSAMVSELKFKGIEEKNILNGKISELENKLRNIPNVSTMEESAKKLDAEYKKLLAFSNQHINVFKNTLKALQGTLDNAIELQDIIVNDMIGK